MTHILSEIMKDFIPDLAVERQVVAAEQDFERKMKQWEFKIEQDKLFREDIRDLVELTVGRMDIYHLVGALILEFCIGFYCENDMIAEDAESSVVPSWVVSLFVISNLTAVGYLVLAVWLSMHASVASHSVGVRLLTGFARLTIPTPEQIDSTKVTLAPMLDRVKAWMGKDAQPSTEEQSKTSQSDSMMDGPTRMTSSGNLQDSAGSVAGSVTGSSVTLTVPPPEQALQGSLFDVTSGDEEKTLPAIPR